MKSQIESLPSQIQGTEQNPNNHIIPELSVWSLLLRLIPLMASFLLFILAISIDASKWGDDARLLQGVIAIAIMLGTIGVVLFIPKRM